MGKQEAKLIFVSKRLGLTFWRGEKCKEEEEEEEEDEEEGEGEEVQKKFRYVFALESWVFGLLRFGMGN